MTNRVLVTLRQVNADASTSVERETPVLEDRRRARRHDGTTAANFAGVLFRQEH